MQVTEKLRCFAQPPQMIVSSCCSSINCGIYESRDNINQLNLFHFNTKFLAQKKIFKKFMADNKK